MTQEQLKVLEDNLWSAADKLRAESGLKPSQYSVPVLGLIFLRFASIRYNRVKKEIMAEYEATKNTRNAGKIEDIALLKCGFYIPPEAEYDYLLSLPEQENIAKKIKEAMELIEKYKPELEGCLPKDEYFELILQNKDNPDKKDYSLPKTLLKTFKDIPEDATGDVFGKVYEYFLGEFALAEGQGGGQFFTPTSVVKLMVEIIEPYNGTIFDPACGSGGMFVQSSDFVDRRRQEINETDTKDLTVYGTEKDGETVKVARMNIAVNGLRGQILKANSYYEDPYECYNKFDFVMANPPFNVDDVNLDRVKEQQRFNEYGIPQNKSKSTSNKQSDANTVPNANYLWINLFATSLKPKGRAALVMANSASDARHSEADIRKNLIKSGVIDCMLTMPKNMFYTVTLPATLWFFNKGEKTDKEKILFIDARNIFRQLTRAHREFSEEHIQNIATIVRLYRGETKRFKSLLAKYQANADEYQKKAKNTEIMLKVTVDEFEEAQNAVNLIRNNETLKKENNKKLLIDLAAANRDLCKIQKEKEELEKQHKTLIEKQQYFLSQISWLNNRFPKGVYEDVTGLCKAATFVEIEEQDFSLNPGRYVGVVIEEDGLTEEEFLADLKKKHFILSELNEKAKQLEIKILNNIKSLNDFA